MNADIRIAWCLLAFLATLALTMALCAICKAEPPSLVDRIAAVVPSIASKSEPSVDPRELAIAIDSVSKGDRRWAALLLTIAVHESALSARISRSEYRPGEGDGGRAWGLWQAHKNAINAATWGSPVLLDQAREGSRAARSAFFMCKRAGVAFPLGIFRALGGRGCSLPLKGEERRVATFNRLVRAL